MHNDRRPSYYYYSYYIVSTYCIVYLLTYLLLLLVALLFPPIDRADPYRRVSSTQIRTNRAGQSLLRKLSRPPPPTTVQSQINHTLPNVTLPATVIYASAERRPRRHARREHAERSTSFKPIDPRSALLLIFNAPPLRGQLVFLYFLNFCVNRRVCVLNIDAVSQQEDHDVYRYENTMYLLFLMRQ